MTEPTKKAADLSTPTLLSEIGATGLQRYAGRVHEEFLRHLQGLRGVRVYSEMRENDPIIGSILFAIEMLMRQVEWYVKGEGAEEDERHEFLESCIGDMSHTWDDFIAEALSMLPYGWSFFEVVYKKRQGLTPPGDAASSMHDDGKLGWRKFSLRSQDTLRRWEFDDNGGIQGLIQAPPPDFVERCIPIEKALLFRTSTHKGNPEGHSVLRTAYRCVSEDTEILTSDGWRFAGDLRRGDALYTLNSQTGAIEIQPATEVHAYRHEGEMVHAESRFVDQLVTPNHRMWVRRDHRDDYEFIEAAECPISVSFKADGEWRQPDAQTVRIGEQVVSVQEWAPFLGLWLAEGHSWRAKPGSTNPYRREVGITQNEGPFADQIRDLLAALPWKFREQRQGRKVTWTATKGELYEHLAPLGKARTKRMPDYVFAWSGREIDSLLNAYSLGDGTIVGDWGDYPGTELLFTASRQLADDLCRLVLLAGMRPQLRWKAGNGFGDGVWAVTVGKPFHRMRASWEVVDYDGYVYCPTTMNGIIYTRRNGKCLWTGNSWYMKKRVEELEAIGVERDLAGIPKIGVPAELLDSTAGDDAKAALAEFESIGKNLRNDEQAFVIYPKAYDEDGHELYSVELMGSAGAKQFNTTEIIERYSRHIAMTVLADIILLGHEKVGSFALAESKADLLTAALTAWLDEIKSVFNKHGVTKLLQLNGFDVTEGMPELDYRELGTIDIAALAGAMQQFAAAGMPLFPDESLEAFVRDQAGWPEKDDTAEDYGLPLGPTMFAPNGPAAPGSTPSPDAAAQAADALESDAAAPPAPDAGVPEVMAARFDGMEKALSEVARRKQVRFAYDDNGNIIGAEVD